jgi:hypothetical protein
MTSQNLQNLRGIRSQLDCHSPGQMVVLLVHAGIDQPNRKLRKRLRANEQDNLVGNHRRCNRWNTPRESDDQVSPSSHRPSTGKKTCIRLLYVLIKNSAL